MPGDDKIRSALDIALEKAEKLGSLSAEERRRLEEQELSEAGEALARRYMDGLPLRDVEVELGRRDSKEREAIVSHLLSSLLNGVDITDTARLDKALGAIDRLYGDSEVAGRIRALVAEYQRALEALRRDNLGGLEEEKRRELEHKGISGSAVQPNVEASVEWLEAREQLDAAFRTRMDEVRALWGTSGQ